MSLRTRPMFAWFVVALAVAAASPHASAARLLRTTIPAVQGTGAVSPLRGRRVVVRGVVTAKTRDGFFLQAEQGDGDPRSSDAIFVASWRMRALRRGQLLAVTGVVSERRIEPWSPRTQTELEQASWRVLGRERELPEPVPAQAEAGSLAYERFEGMRVSLPRALVVAPTGGRFDVASGKSMSNGVFYVVPAGMARPLLVEGASLQQRLRVESYGQPGAPAFDVDAGDKLADLRGVLGEARDSYRLLPDADSPQLATATAPRAVARRRAVEIATLDLGTLVDDTDNRDGQPVASFATYSQRIAKATSVICRWLGAPEVVAVRNAGSRAVMLDLAEAANDPLLCGTGPGYVLASDGGRDATQGLLVRTTHSLRGIPLVTVDSLHRELARARFRGRGRVARPLFEQPPVLAALRLGLKAERIEPVTLVLATLSRQGEDARRQAQSAALARLLRDRLARDPDERIVVLADLDAADLDRGEGDLVSRVRGAMHDASADLPVAERYTSLRDGVAQLREHVFVSAALQREFPKLAIEVARLNADFAVDNAADGSVPMRTSAQDPQVLLLR